MQPVAIPPKTGKVAFQQGLIFGLIQAVIASIVLLINTFVDTTANSGGIALLLTAVSFLTGLAAYFVAGILAARQTGKVSTGTLAGIWTGGIYGIIGFVLSMVLFFQVNLPKALNVAYTSALVTNNSDAFRTGVIIGGVAVEVFGLLFAIGLGAGLGALGGLIGRNISQFKPVPVMPGYPVYPGQAMPAPYPGQPYAMPAPYPGQAYPAPASAEPYPPVAPTEQVSPEQ